MGRVRERVKDDTVCIHIGMRDESSVKLVFFFLYLHETWFRATSGHWILLVSPCFSTLASLTLGHLKALNHLSFFSVWCKTRAQSNVTFSSCLLWSSLLCLSVVYMILWTCAQILMVPPPVCCLCIAHGYASFSHATYAIYAAPLLETSVSSLLWETGLFPVYFLFLQNFFLTWHPHNLHGMSKGIFKSISKNIIVVGALIHCALLYSYLEWSHAQWFESQRDESAK